VIHGPRRRTVNTTITMRTGILPTFGPSWINLYGSVRQFKVVGGNDHELNEGIGDTPAFRGRLLLSIATTIIEGEIAGRSTVKREPLLRSSGVVSRLFLCLSVAYFFCSIASSYMPYLHSRWCCGWRSDWYGGVWRHWLLVSSWTRWKSKFSLECNTLDRFNGKLQRYEFKWYYSVENKAVWKSYSAFVGTWRK